jgi:TPR repeat protein
MIVIRGGVIRLSMPNEKNVPATVPTNSTLPEVQSDGLGSRGLLAVRQSLAVPEKEDAEGLFRKGMRFRNGDDGTPPDADKARSYLSAAAKLNHAEAQFEFCVLLGEYDEWPEAVGWLETSVSLGLGPAQRYLADGLSDPLIADHLSKNDYSESQLYRQAVVWYEGRASAGAADAQYDFASWLNHPDCPMHNRTEAMRWMRAAALQDHGFACMRFGEMLLEATGPEHSTEQGIYWLSRAADLGKSHACRILGDLYLFGHTGDRYARETVLQIMAPDKRLAVSWYERQIELDKARGSFLAADSLARLYLIGEHLDQDLALAERMLLEAANAGNLESQRLLAFEYTSGKRLKRDTAAALHWLKMAEQNSGSSKLRDQYQLGYFYEHNADDAPNYIEAVNWYRKAADEGDYRSQKSFGVFYEAGSGVPKDYVQAYKWYLLSVANSYGKAGIKDFHAAALKSRDLLAQKLSPAQLAESRQLARAWMDQITSLHATDYELAREGLDRAS